MSQVSHAIQHGPESELSGMSVSDHEIRARGGWFWLANWFVDEHMVAVGGGPTQLYLALIRHGNGYTRQTSITVKKLSETLKTNRRTVFRWMEVLEAHELIRRDSGQGGNSNVYLILPIEDGRLSTDEPSFLDDRIAEVQPHPESTPRDVKGAQPPRRGDGGGATHVENGTAPGTHVTSRVTPGDARDGVFATHNKEDNTSQDYRQEQVLVALQFLPHSISPHDERLPPEELSWRALIAEIDSAWSSANGNQKCPWGPLAFRRLKDAINSATGWGHSEWRQCICHRFQSDPVRVNLGESPETFIPRLKDFFAGPRNRWGGVARKGQDEQPSRSGGKAVTFEQQRRTNNDTAFAEAEQILRAKFAGQ
jgi:hypothetical protein